MQITERVSRPGWSGRHVDGDRFRATFVNAMAVAHFAAGRYAEAVASARNTFARSPEYPPGHIHFIAAAAMQGDMEAGAKAFAGLLRQRADFSMAWVSENMAYRGEVGERLREELRKARVPVESPAGKE